MAIPWKPTVRPHPGIELRRGEGDLGVLKAQIEMFKQVYHLFEHESEGKSTEEWTGQGHNPCV